MEKGGQSVGENTKGYWLYIAAYYAMQKMASVCCTDLESDEEGKVINDEVYLVSGYQDPEKLAIKKDYYEKLSGEAKFVIDLLIKEEFEEVSHSRKNKIPPSKNKLGRILQSKYRWSRLKLNRTFKELQEYTSVL